MKNNYMHFMRDLEMSFKLKTGLPDRSAYKIFYCEIRPAPILTLGINPGGSPLDTNPDGRTGKNGKVACASASYFENNEHDILDCDWRENRGLLKVLLPLLGGEQTRIRTEVIKTNLAFHRSAKKNDIDIEAAMDQTAPFLDEIIKVVNPLVILLTGAKLLSFTSRLASYSKMLAEPEKDPGIKQVVFAPARVTIKRTGKTVLVVQIAHASQFSWTYEKYDVARRILGLMNQDVVQMSK